MKLVIDRQRWLRGEEDSFLLRSDDNKMCCLGFYSLALGLKEVDILDVACPNEVDFLSAGQEYPDWIYKNVAMRVDHSDDINKLMRYNDDVYIPSEVREEKIRETFAKHGVEVEFVG